MGLESFLLSLERVCMLPGMAQNRGPKYGVYELPGDPILSRFREWYMAKTLMRAVWGCVHTPSSCSGMGSRIRGIPGSMGSGIHGIDATPHPGCIASGMGCMRNRTY